MTAASNDDVEPAMVRYAVQVSGAVETPYIDTHHIEPEDAHAASVEARNYSAPGVSVEVVEVPMAGQCATCHTPLVRIDEAHDSYYIDHEGESLSYVPTLHDHTPKLHCMRCGEPVGPDYHLVRDGEEVVCDDDWDERLR